MVVKHWCYEEEQALALANRPALAGQKEEPLRNSLNF